MSHGCLQAFNRRQLTLVRAAKRGVGDVDRIKETGRPGFRPGRLKNNCIAILANENRGWQANTLGQANSLTVAFHSHDCSFHSGKYSRIPAQAKAILSMPSDL